MSETRKLVAILVADIVGFSRLAGADEERILARLRTLRSDLIDPMISVHHGRIVKRTGDGGIVEFRSVVAVRCAIEIQNGLIERNSGLSPERRIEFRVGVHVGDVVEESDGDLMGDGVNIAARLESVAKPGEKTDMIRLRAGISYALTEAMDEGHCGLPTDQLIPLAEELLEAPKDLILTALELERSEGAVVADRVGDTACTFLAGLYKAEQAIALRRRQLAALVTWFLAGARSHTVALAFEDLHWADPTSLDLMQALAKRGAQAPLLILATARPEFHPPWSLRSHHSVISLSALKVLSAVAQDIT